MLRRVCQHDAWILAVSEHTREPVAIATNYLWQPGLLVLAPPFSIEELSPSLEIEGLLVEFAESIREQIQRLENRDIPDWAKEHRAPKVVEIVRQIEQHRAVLDSLEAELNQYDEMLYLLCGKSELLARQVEKLFSARTRKYEQNLHPKAPRWICL